ncbi:MULTISPECIES: hypothetical protein [unclassified Sphingosinithalassobacter]|uniref:hypothetical protein n=1 Tax=unclassified Sphingosinithalassobacter TaxID=2676235 RepID=UPI00165D67CD|nr:hypothetical protein [Sphingosinithalassobacter sp. CS137]
MRTAAAKRYTKRFFTTMAAYVVVLSSSSWALNNYDPSGAARILLSVLPALPVIAALVVIGIYLVEETDEFLRRQIVSAMLFGIGVVLSISTVLGFMQYAEVIGQVDVFWAFPIWCISWGLAQCAVGLRDKAAGAGE